MLKSNKSRTIIQTTLLGLGVLSLDAKIVNASENSPACIQDATSGNSGSSTNNCIVNNNHYKEKIPDFRGADARVTLNKIGVEWKVDKFVWAIHQGDTEIVKLFIQGGMSPHAEPEAGELMPTMLALNKSNPKKILDILIKRGLDINHKFLDRGSDFSLPSVCPKTPVLKVSPC